MNKELLYNNLLQTGMSAKWALDYIDIITSEEKTGIYNEQFLQFSHSHGFWARNASYYNLTEQNMSSYLSDINYYKIWPVNDWERIWINDKLTMKLIFEGTEFDSFMPEYYYYSTRKGLKELSNSHFGNSFDSFIQSLKKNHLFACKPNNGSGAEGFHKLCYMDNEFYIDNDKSDINGVKNFVENHPNYIFTEYLIPDEFFSKYSNLIHTIRINTLNIHGDDPIIVGEWVRLPSKQTTIANNASLENKDKYNIITHINTATGALDKTVLAYADRAIETNIHPDTNCRIEGLIENHKLLIDTILNICKKLNTIEWMGFDVCVAKNGFKCMEINSHPGIMYDQMFNPWMTMPIVGDYFKSKIQQIDILSSEQKKSRNNLIR